MMKFCICLDVNWSKKVKPHVSFFHWPNVKFTKFSCLIQNCLKQMKTLTQLKLGNNILGVITQSLNWKY